MPDDLGWMGSAAELYASLRAAGCDQDAHGRYKVGGGIASFMGAGQEFIVDAGAVYYKGGRPKRLVPALRGGIRCMVIM